MGTSLRSSRLVSEQTQPSLTSYLSSLWLGGESVILSSFPFFVLYSFAIELRTIRIVGVTTQKISPKDRAVKTTYALVYGSKIIPQLNRPNGVRSEISLMNLE